MDASLATKWLLAEVDTDKADELALLWARTGVRPVAPYLLPIEVANVMLQRVRRGQISLESAGRRIVRLFDSGLELTQPAELHFRAIELASSLQQGAVYDAHYLALAEMLDCDLWTADERFYSSVRSTYRQVRLLAMFIS